MSLNTFTSAYHDEGLFKRPIVGLKLSLFDLKSHEFLRQDHLFEARNSRRTRCLIVLASNWMSESFRNVLLTLLIGKGVLTRDAIIYLRLQTKVRI